MGACPIFVVVFNTPKQVFTATQNLSGYVLMQSDWFEDSKCSPCLSFFPSPLPSLLLSVFLYETSGRPLIAFSPHFTKNQNKRKERERKKMCSTTTNSGKLKASFCAFGHPLESNNHPALWMQRIWTCYAVNIGRLLLGTTLLMRTAPPDKA